MFEVIRASGLAVALMVAPVVASAATIVVEDGQYDIGYGDEFAGIVVAEGGAGSFMVEFDSVADPLGALASATIGRIVAGTFTNLTVAWVSVFDDTVISSSPVLVPVTELATIFSGDDVDQFLVFSWDTSTAGAGFDFEVAAAVPVPATGLLLLTALGGAAALRRRKTA